MAQLPTEPVTTALVGVVILVVGYLVKYRGWTFLVSESTALLPEKGLPVFASMIANITLVAGGFVLLLSGLQVAGFASMLPDWLLAVVLVAAVVGLAPRLSLRTEFQ